MGQRPKPSPSEPAYAHKHTHSPPSIVHVRGESEATDFSRRSAGAAAGFPPLRRPLRRREGGETSDPRVRCVNSLFCLIVVSAMGVAAAATCFPMAMLSSGVASSSSWVVVVGRPGVGCLSDVLLVVAAYGEVAVAEGFLVARSFSVQ
ncbi:hypothetical protein VPH35_089890 [Triticum aestivum]